MVAVVLLFLISLGIRLIVSWKNFGDLDHNAPGTWVAMAVDASDGLFYRPIVSSVGYGGTRYGPLLIAVQAGLIRIGLNPIVSGFVLGLIAAGLVVTGLFAMLRALHVPAAIAAGLALAALAPACVRINILAIRGDLLPVAMGLWGMTAVICSPSFQKQRDRILSICLAAVLFAFASATKITSLYGLAAAFVWLLGERRFRDGLILLSSWAAVMLVLVSVTQWASAGRALSILRICASGGGGLRQIIHGPHKMLYDAWENDHLFLVVGCLAFALLIMNRSWRSLPAIYLLFATAGTMIIYGSPGTKFNHLADMTAASLLLIGFECQRSRRLTSLALVCTIVLVGLSSIACILEARAIRQNAVRSNLEAALSEVNSSPVPGPVLSEDPLLPVLNNERPYLLDSFMLRVIRNQRPDISNQLWDGLAKQRFRAVVLHAEPTNELYKDANDGDFGPGFVEHVEQSYHLASVRGHLFIFLPKATTTASG